VAQRKPVGSIYAHLPEPEPERMIQTARDRRSAGGGGLEEKKKFLPHRKQARSRVVRSVALNKMNLLYRG